MTKSRVDLQVSELAKREWKPITTTGMRPGELVLVSSTDKWARSASAASAQEVWFLLELALTGKTSADTFTANDLAEAVRPLPGDIVYAWLKDGQSVVPGDPLDSAGALGELQKATIASTKHIIGWSIDTAAPSGAAGRVQVRVA